MTPETDSSYRGYSPPIQITLEIGGEELPVAQVGPEFLILRTPRDFAPTTATLVITVDGDPVRHELILPQGIRSQDRRIRIIDLEDKAPLAQAG